MTLGVSLVDFANLVIFVDLVDLVDIIDIVALENLTNIANLVDPGNRIALPCYGLNTIRWS